MKNLSQSFQGLERDWALLPYKVDKIRGKYLVVSMLGGWDFLNNEEYTQLNALNLEKGTKLVNRLKEKGLIVEGNGDMDKCIDDYRCTNLNLFTDVGLHIAVLTNKCNLRCLYCQTNSKAQDSMSKEVASRVLEFVFSGKNPNATIEFQGGEPLLNWDVLRFFVDYTRKYNLTGKGINLSLVSNFTLMDQKKLNFLIDNDVSLCTSLDGPKKVHDKNRKMLDGGSSYDKVIYWVDKIGKEYKKRKIKHKTLGFLPTLTKHNLPFYKEIIDEYVRLGQVSIPIRPINKLGLAKDKWREIGYTAEEFIDFWIKSLDYILEINKKDVFIYERMAYVMLKKILTKEDPGYVDLCSPCGAGRSVVAYSPEGNVYTCDEARMIGEDLFKLGNVLEDSYYKSLGNSVSLQTCQASLLDFWDYSSPYSAWGGTCPVLNYVEQSSPVVKIAQSSLYKIQTAQFKYLFEKIAEDGEDLKIFKKWVCK